MLNLRPLCCKSQSNPVKQAPCEKPSIPSNGPSFSNTSSINFMVSPKPTAGPPFLMPLNVLSSLLKNHPYCSKFKMSKV